MAPKVTRLRACEAATQGIIYTRANMIRSMFNPKVFRTPVPDQTPNRGVQTFASTSTGSLKLYGLTKIALCGNNMKSLQSIRRMVPGREIVN